MNQRAPWYLVLMLSLLEGSVASCNFEHPDPELTTATFSSDSEDLPVDTSSTDSDHSTTVDTSSTNTDPWDTGSNFDTDTGPNGSEVTDELPQDTDPPADPPVLGVYHQGWMDPGCWSASCHLKTQTHNSQMKPNGCVKCHGKNGATKRAPPHFPCVGCHSPIKNHDPVTDFPDTGTCLNCHG